MVEDTFLPYGVIADCLRVAAKREYLRLRPRLIRMAAESNVMLIKADFDNLESSILKKFTSEAGVDFNG